MGAEVASRTGSALERAAAERCRLLLEAVPWGDGATVPVRAGYEQATDASGRLDRLANASVDVFDAGDALDRVADTAGFLDEIHRVLRPRGILVATACNAEPHLYAQTGVRFGTHGGRPGLTTFRELRAFLVPRFDLVSARGFNASVHPTLDAHVADPGFAQAWAGQLGERPDLTTNVVVMARRREQWHPARRRTQVVEMDDPGIAWEGPWATVPLHEGVTGRLGSGGDASALSLEVYGTDVLVFFWAHGWSGQATIEVDGVARHVVGLASATAGIRRVHVGGLASGPHRLHIRGSRARPARSAGDQLIVQAIVAYDEPAAGVPANEEPAMETDHNFPIRPGRFGIIYTTPAHMTAPERVLVYGLVFALQPRRTLEIGTFRGGSALVIGAALDDIGAGTMVCVDPAPQVAPEHWALVSHRATLLAEPSPGALPRAREIAGGPFDFALIDGDHQYPGVVADIEGVLPFLAPEAHILFHDAHYFEVADAIDRMLSAHADRLTDCGLLSTGQTPENRSAGGRPIVWGGLRLVRHHRAP